jgi:RimJ/RimL family protein N-acetyltransferase
MKLEKDGIIRLNDKNYEYMFIDIDELIDLIRHNPKFISSWEEEIKIYRNNPNFKIFDLIKEYIYQRTDSYTYFFITYKNDTIISFARLHYYKEKQYGYINLVYTNVKYRGLGFCKKGINFIINMTKRYIKTYELLVVSDNIPAKKCYEANGFKFIKKIQNKLIAQNDPNKSIIIENDLMELKI